MSERKKHFLITPLFAVLGKAGGIIIPFLIAFYFGAGTQSDAFFLAFGLVISFSGLFTPLFESLMLPYLAELKGDRFKVSSFVNAATVIVFPGVLLVIFLTWLFLDKVFAGISGVSPETSALCAKLFLEMAPFLIFWLLASGSNGIFYSSKVFWFPAFSPFLRSVLVIASLFLFSSRLSIHSASLGFAAGECVRWAVGLWLLLKSSRWVLKADWRAQSQKLKSFFSQAGFQIAALFSLNLIPLTDQWFASWLGEGNLSLISYADRLFQIPFQLLMVGFLQIFLSYWSDQYYRNSPKEFWEKSFKDIRIAGIAVLCFSAGLWMGRDLLVQLLFGFGEIQAGDREVLASLFGWLMVGFLPCILNLLYVRILFVLKKSSVFMVQSLIRLVLNIVFNYIFMKIWGIEGLAISTAMVYLTTTLWLYFYLRGLKKAEVMGP